ncbi:MAG TPA: N-formylglutamate deformylase [Novosphingobium sp.]
MSAWLRVTRGAEPLIIAFPHAGTSLADLGPTFRSEWLARRDADWWIDRLYGFAASLGATLVATSISRSVIDVNRDPGGASLYPGRATTELCPATTFDGEPLHARAAPDTAETSRRLTQWFHPYHSALAQEIARLRRDHRLVVVYDAHSIRSRIPRLFDGELPLLNIGTNCGTTCDPRLVRAVESVCAASGRSHVVDGRFRGGWTTRHYGRPDQGVHAIQMELAMRAYLDEPTVCTEANWPPPFTHDRAAQVAGILREVLAACLTFARF